MREYNVSVLIRDEWEDFDVASQKQAVDYVRRAIDAYQRVERVSLYKVRALKAKVDSTAHNKQSTPLPSCISCGNNKCSMQAGSCSNWRPRM